MLRSELKKVTEAMYSVKSFRDTINLLLLGYHGVSKTQFVDELGLVLGLPVVTVIGSQIEPTDLTGLPSLVDGRAVYARPSTLLDEPQILFLDEINSAPPDVRFSMFSLLCSHKVGQHKLCPGSIVIAAGNPENSVYDVAEISNEAFWDRLCIIEFSPDYEGFVSYLKAGEAPMWALTNLSPSTFRYSELPPIQIPVQKPSFRSYEISVRLMEHLLSAGISSSAVEELVSGYCGREVAINLMTAYETANREPVIDPYEKFESQVKNLWNLTEEERKELDQTYLSLDPEWSSKLEMSLDITEDYLRKITSTDIYPACPNLVARLVWTKLPVAVSWEEHRDFFLKLGDDGLPNVIEI